MSNGYLERIYERKNKTRKILLILIILILIIVFYKVNKNNTQNFNETDAIVISVRYNINKELYVEYKYNVYEKEYEGYYIERINLLAPKEGETIKIRYNKQNNSISKPNLIKRYFKHILLIITFLVIMILIYIFKFKQ